MVTGVIGEKKSSASLPVESPWKEEEDLRKQIKGGERVVIFHPSTFIFKNSWRHLFFFSKRITKKVALKSKILKKNKIKIVEICTQMKRRKKKVLWGWLARPVRLCCRWCFCPSVRPPDKHGASLREPPPVTFSFFALFLLCPRVYIHVSYMMDSTSTVANDGHYLFSVVRQQKVEAGRFTEEEKNSTSFFLTLTKKTNYK